MSNQPPAQRNTAQIHYFGQQVLVSCDRQCSKAWGINSRPREQLSDDDDDYAFLTDGELADAPTDPGTYEGGHAKPHSPNQFPNKWCVRECERCVRSDIGEDVELPDFTRRHFNLRPRQIIDSTITPTNY